MTAHSAIVNRLKAVAAYQITRSIASAARRIGKSASFVAYWVKRMKTFGHVNNLPRVFRSTVLSTAAIQRAQQLILALQSTRLTTQQLKHEGLVPASMHYTTLWRHLGDGSNPVKHRAVQNKPLITDATAAKRVAFAKLHHKKTKWDKVLFVDSKYFYVARQVSRKLWVPADERPSRVVVKHSPALHVYLGFSSRGITPLVEVSGTTGHRFDGPAGHHRGMGAAEYQMVLNNHLIPAARRMFRSSKWQLLQDGAPPHRAASTTALLAQQGVQVVQRWPGSSPDLNPIENLWGWLARRVQARPVTTLAQLRIELQAAWRAVPPSLLRALASSMDTRLQLVKRHKGAYIGY